MSKNCGHIEPCGCGETFLSMTNAVACSYPNCAGPKQCAEINPSKCLVYTGDSIANLGIYNGMNFDTIIQILGSFILGPGCMYPDSPVQSAVGIQSELITSSIVKLSWLPVVNSPSYTVQYKLPTSVNWISSTATDSTYDTIAGLAPNTTYLFRVVTTLNSNSCNSLSLQIKTKV